MVSVIIPLYNGEKTILRSLNSIKSQTYTDFEVIIINDGSKDKGPKLVQEYIEINKDLKITFVNKENGGVSSARNAGMKLAKGSFIAFLDADDEWKANKLERQLSVFEENKELDFLAAILHEPEEKNANQLRFIKLEDLIYKNYFQPSTVLMKTIVYQTIGVFNEAQRYAEEGNYFIRVAKQFNCALLYDKLIVYGDGKNAFGESGLSANLLEMEKGELMNLRFAYESGYISYITFTIAKYFSLMKYFRRIIIVKMRKI